MIVFVGVGEGGGEMGGSQHIQEVLPAKHPSVRGFLAPLLAEQSASVVQRNPDWWHWVLLTLKIGVGDTCGIQQA